jgi:hypothetical protein
MDTANDQTHNPTHINIKINQIFNHKTPISTVEAHKQCSKAIGAIVKKASRTLSDKLRDKKTKDMTKYRNTTIIISKHRHAYSRGRGTNQE